jgi:hypothetical protein
MFAFTHFFNTIAALYSLETADASAAMSSRKNNSTKEPANTHAERRAATPSAKRMTRNGLDVAIFFAMR